RGAQLRSRGAERSLLRGDRGGAPLAGNRRRSPERAVEEERAFAGASRGGARLGRVRGVLGCFARAREARRAGAKAFRSGGSGGARGAASRARVFSRIPAACARVSQEHLPDLQLAGDGASI